ncbi:hypothetical protein LSAT2_005719 [Lamellibrachia satsuma]|nr:hypothetical protein LSAT2_005719 [Lamellibrachia satsuma]
MQSANDRPRSGQPPVTTSWQDRHIVSRELRDKIRTASHTAAATLGRNNQRICNSTVRSIYTGSIYGDSALRKNGFPGERVDSESVIVIKTHRGPRDRAYDRAVLLIRNPAECILAEFNRQMSRGNHIGVAPYSAFQSGRWNSFVKGYLPRWRTFNLLWLLDFKGPMHVIFYEDLKEDMRRELTKIAEFLRVQPKFMECALQNSQGNFLRKNKTNYRQVYDKELTTLAEQSSLEKRRSLSQYALLQPHSLQNGVGKFPWIGKHVDSTSFPASDSRHNNSRHNNNRHNNNRHKQQPPQTTTVTTTTVTIISATNNNRKTKAVTTTTVTTTTVTTTNVTTINVTTTTATNNNRHNNNLHNNNRHNNNPHNNNRHKQQPSQTTTVTNNNRHKQQPSQTKTVTTTTFTTTTATNNNRHKQQPSQQQLSQQLPSQQQPSQQQPSQEQPSQQQLSQQQPSQQQPSQQQLSQQQPSQQQPSQQQPSQQQPSQQQLSQQQTSQQQPSQQQLSQQQPSQQQPSQRQPSQQQPSQQQPSQQQPSQRQPLLSRMTMHRLLWWNLDLDKTK